MRIVSAAAASSDWGSIVEYSHSHVRAGMIGCLERCFHLTTVLLVAIALRRLKIAVGDNEALYANRSGRRDGVALK